MVATRCYHFPQMKEEIRPWTNQSPLVVTVIPLLEILIYQALVVGVDQLIKKIETMILIQKKKNPVIFNKSRLNEKYLSRAEKVKYL